MKPLIKVSNLSKRYHIGGRAFNTTFRERVNQIVSTPLRRIRGRDGGADAGLVWALEGIDFTVRRGEVVGIIGRNGSGKSTLLKLLSLITEPTTGYVELYGRFGSLLEVGTGFHPELSGRENIFLNGAILGMKSDEIRRHFDEIVAFAEIEPFIDTPVKRYSSGMYLRLAFAVAAHLRAEILLIDEVLAVGDVEFQKKCLGKMEGVAKDGRTVLLVSHNMGAVAELCQRVLWLNSGRLELDGPPREVVSSYFAKAYGGSHKWERTEPDRSTDLEKKPAALRSVRICQDGQVELGAVRFDREFTAEVEYEVKVATSEMRVVLRLVSEFGVTVFSSHDTDTTSDRRGTRPAGLYVSACNIPGNLLRTGKLFVTVGIMRQGLWVDFEENVLLFEVTAIGNPLNPGRMGVITPVLEWDIRTIGEQTHGRRP